MALKNQKATNARHGKNGEKIRASREKGRQALQLRYEQNLTWQEIADQLGYKTRSAALKAAEKIEAQEDGDNVSRLRKIQHKRLESMYRGLEQKIGQGRERAIEVGVKVLERQARLHGLDEVDAPNQGQNRTQVIIQISAHPADRDAIEYLHAREGEVLSPPIEGLVLGEENDSPNRGNGSGENVVRALLDHPKEAPETG